MTLAYNDRGVELRHCPWTALAERARELGGVDACIVDAPYSDRTHAGAYETSERAAADGGERRAINYAAWGTAEVGTFVSIWTRLVRDGWFVSITDDVLAPAWRNAFEGAGLVTFPMIPCIERGSGVRMAGDGPSSVTTFAVVARTRSRAMATWGTLPGFYDGTREAKPIVGGKPVWLMRALVRDYTRPGDLVVDPCAGAGTLGVACIAEGRRALLGDCDAAHVAIAAKRLASCPGEQKRLVLDVDAKPMEQASLLGETGT